MSDLHIQVFYDGVDVANYANRPEVKGITTNISFMAAANISDYNEFITNSVSHSGNKPISFQTYADTTEELENDARRITGYGQNVYVKVPVMSTSGVFNTDLIHKLHSDNVKVNVTSVYTVRQIDELRNVFGSETPTIVSIFAGKVADTGVNPRSIVEHAVSVFSDRPNVEILWAACRSVYNIFEAQDAGCHIITVPDSVINRMGRIGNDLEEMTIDTVKTFRNDGVKGNIHF